MGLVFHGRYVDKMAYCFTVYNLEEEIQLNDFLGIDPPGADMDTYLSALTQEGLIEWRNYWINIWTNFDRTDIVNFVNSKYDEYYEEPEYPKEVCR